MKQLIRQRVFVTLAERYAVGGSIAAYPESGGKFPYEMGDQFVAIPDDINPLQNYVHKFKAFSSNDEVYEFPKEEFLLGLRIEKDKLPQEPVLSIAQKVLDHLKDDPQFYSNLK